jgi:hypothetical protein
MKPTINVDASKIAESTAKSTDTVEKVQATVLSLLVKQGFVEVDGKAMNFLGELADLVKGTKNSTVHFRLFNILVGKVDAKNNTTGIARLSKTQIVDLRNRAGMSASKESLTSTTWTL